MNLVEKMKYLLILTLLSITFFGSTAFLCRSFDKSTKSLSYFCIGKSLETKFVKCLNVSFEVDSLQVSQLKVEGCDRETISTAIKSYQNVLMLDFSNSHYKSSDDVESKDHTLDLLDVKHRQMQKINGSHNELTHIPRGFLKDYPELIEIDYSHNKLESFHLNEFDGASKLKRIHLTHNFIRSLNPEDFANVLELEYIDLSHNQIQYYWADVFRDSIQLKTLNLEFNPIEYFNCRDFFKLSKASVHISWENFQHLILKFCDEVKFDVVITSEREGFLATSKGKYEIHCDEGSFEHVTYFSIAPNQIKDVSMLMQCLSLSVEDISLDGSSLGKVEPAMIRRFTNLKRLSLRGSHLTEFDFTLLINQRKLEELDISNNHLKFLRNVALSQFSPNLTRFIAAGNEFENVTEILRYLTPSIRSLDLSGSFVGKANVTTFDRLKQLTELKLRRTGLVISDSVNPFEQLQGLTELDISYNNLEKVDFKLLSTTLNRSKTFRANNCNIKNILAVTQHLGASLETLDLSGNFLGDLNATTFKRVTNLENLFLDNAYITNFEWDSLKRQMKLLDLRITNNKLNRIDLGAISTSLRWLNLEGNELIEIKNLTKQHFPSLESLKVSNNQLSCKALAQLKHEWRDKLINFNLWDQKHKQNCHPSFRNKTAQ